MQVCERQAGTRSMHIQYSYNSNVSILLVSLLSRASGSLSFYTCVLCEWRSESSKRNEEERGISTEGKMVNG